ncbi:hypothetical protein GIB67_033083 [Kingdonia uniflora]|uniref:40S ribosomal protein S9 n=1 Tax=Kingdonia uniflora TaxID=39325 RepID=A0A7J7MYF9_9MAGN|nr:hypothetical protein GIB67_033083 [Kingdonia uniflora]
MLDFLPLTPPTTDYSDSDEGEQPVEEDRELLEGGSGDDDDDDDDYGLLSLFSASDEDEPTRVRKMVNVSFYRNYGKTFKKPRRPYEKERLDAELKLVGEYGLRCKRELWRVQYALSRIRNNARNLLTLDEKNSRRIFEGDALLRRMNRYGLLDESQNKLDYVLALTVENFLERRLQTLVFKAGMAKSIHHARVLIRQRHIRVGRQVVNIPSFMVKVDSQKHIDFSLTSPFGGGRPGRLKRRNQKSAAKKAAGGDGEEEDEE